MPGYARGVRTIDFSPGEMVPRSGVYRVSHHAHRLMHEAALLADDLFPSCVQCGEQVRFELLRILRDDEVLPFRTGEILEAYPKPEKLAG